MLPFQKGDFSAIHPIYLFFNKEVFFILQRIFTRYLLFFGALSAVDYFRSPLYFAHMDISKIWLLLVLVFFI
jgi:hypothetical protein